jgi:hypothetical protein
MKSSNEFPDLLLETMESESNGMTYLRCWGRGGNMLTRNSISFKNKGEIKTIPDTLENKIMCH